MAKRSAKRLKRAHMATGGNLDSNLKERGKFKLNLSTLEISGVVKVDIYTPNGETIISGAGTIKCTKIGMESLN